MFILGLALGILVLGDVLLILARLRWYYWTVPRLRPVDQTHLKVSPPEGLKHIVDALAALGFTRLGEAGLPAKSRLSGPVQIWYFVDPERTTIVGTFVTDRAHAVIYSWFARGAVIVTAYPVGDRLEKPNYSYHTVTTSLADAYRSHQARLADFKTRFGPPTIFQSMATVLELDAYNQKFARRRGRSGLWRGTATSIFQVYLMLVALGTVIVMEDFHPPAIDVLSVMGALIVLGGGVFWIARQR